ERIRELIEPHRRIFKLEPDMRLRQPRPMHRVSLLSRHANIRPDKPARIKPPPKLLIRRLQRTIKHLVQWHAFAAEPNVKPSPPVGIESPTCDPYASRPVLPGQRLEPHAVSRKSNLAADVVQSVREILVGSLHAARRQRPDELGVSRLIAASPQRPRDVHPA